MYRTRPSLAAWLAAIVAALLLTMPPAHAQGSTTRRGYVTRNGVQVPPSRQTRPDGSKFNNWSTKGNTNPYTGRAGTVDPLKPRASRRR